MSQSVGDTRYYVHLCTIYLGRFLIAIWAVARDGLDGKTKNTVRNFAEI